MVFNKMLVKIYFCFVIFCLFSCYSNPKSMNGLIDYSDTILPKTEYFIGIDIFNKDISILKQNIYNEIIQNNGEIMQEEMENINQHRVMVCIPKNNTGSFITKIKTFGIVVNEHKRVNNLEDGINNNEMRLINAKDILERYNGLLKDSTSVSDKLMLEKEINSVKWDIEGINREKKELELRIENNNITIFMFNR